MEENDLPPFSRSLGRNETFIFACHPKVACFTECCRQLDLPLTPYDVLRLKNCLGIASQQFLERYVEMSEEDEGGFASLFLAMNDDEGEQCPFVTPNGCSVYPHRPGPCRFYPVGRGVCRSSGHQVEEQFILVEEEHCQGFREGTELTVATWTADQELEKFIAFNDRFAEIVQHTTIVTGVMRPDEKQQDLYILALYNLDLFRQQILQGHLPSSLQPPGLHFDSTLERDEAWLDFALTWLAKELFR